MRHTLFQRQVFCDVQQPLHCKDCTYVSDERGPQHNWQKCLYSCCCICTHPSLLHSGMMAMHLLNHLLLHTFHFAVIEGCELIVCYIVLLYPQHLFGTVLENDWTKYPGRGMDPPFTAIHWAVFVTEPLSADHCALCSS